MLTKLVNYTKSNFMKLANMVSIEMLHIAPSCVFPLPETEMKYKTER